jgi:ectoine hydroxylase-related dioxygenase (phytanoyl-CoA dioxygenase family)
MLTEQTKQQFQKNGYLIAENIISRTLTEKMRRDVEILRIAEEKDYAVIFENRYCADEYIACLPKYDSFKQVLEYPALIDIVEQLLDAPCELVMSYLNHIAPGQGVDIWHQDFDAIKNQAQIGITLGFHDISTPEEILKVIPESHSWPAPVEAEFYQSFPNEVHLIISSQTAIIQDPSLWHAGQINNSNESKWLFFFYYKVADSTNNL